MVLLRPCRTSAAYEAIPESDLELDIPRLEARLMELGWAPLANAGIMLVVRKNVEATIFQSGKLLIKTRERDRAEQVWNELGPALEAAAHGS